MRVAGLVPRKYITLAQKLVPNEKDELLAASIDPQADELCNAERQRDQSGDGRKYAYMAEAARSDAATKKYFDDARLLGFAVHPRHGFELGRTFLRAVTAA